MTQDFRGDPDARGRQNFAIQNARELCFEWRIGENDAPTLAHEVAAAGAEFLLSGYAVDSVGSERRVSPPPRC